MTFVCDVTKTKWVKKINRYYFAYTKGLNRIVYAIIENIYVSM